MNQIFRQQSAYDNCNWGTVGWSGYGKQDWVVVVTHIEQFLDDNMNGRIENTLKIEKICD